MKKPIAGMVAKPPSLKTPKPKSTGPSVISKIKGAFADKPKYTSEQIVENKKLQAEIDTKKKNKSKTTGKPAVQRKSSTSTGTKKPMPKIQGAKPGVKKPMGKTTTKAPAKMTPKPKVTKKPEKMTPQDAAMKKILEKRYGKIYG